MSPTSYKNPVTFEFEGAKAVAAIAYLASKPELVTDLDKYKAAKLILLADKYHLVRYGRPIVGGEYRALDHGPVPQNTLDLLHSLFGKGPRYPKLLAALQELVELTDFHLANPRIRARASVPMEHLSPSDVAALDHVINKYGRMPSFPDLKMLTHAMPAYEKVWNSKPKDAKTAQVFYEDFFEEEPDAVEGAFEEMTENDALRKSFQGH